MRRFGVLFAFSLGLLIQAGSSSAVTINTFARITIVSGCEALIVEQPASGMDRFSLSGPADHCVNIQLKGPGAEIREFNSLADTKGMLQLDIPVDQPAYKMSPSSDYIISVVYE